MKRLQRALALITAAIFAIGTSAAAAQQVQLTWTAPRECLSESVLKQRIAAILTRGAGKREALRARGRIVPRRRAYVLELVVEVGNDQATRTLQATTCTELSEAAAWLIAITADPAVSGSTPHPTEAAEQPAARAAGRASAGDERSTADAGEAPEPSASLHDRNSTPDEADGGTPATVESAQTASVARIPARAQAPEGNASENASTSALRWRARGGVFTGLWGARLPAPQASLGACAGLGLDMFYAELRYDHVFARTQSLRDGIHADISSDELEIAGCAAWGSRLRYGPCVALAGVRSAGAVRGPVDPQDKALFWSKVGPSGRVSWLLGAQVELWLEAGLSLAITPRPRFTLSGLEGKVAEGALFSGFLRLGMNFETH